MKQKLWITVVFVIAFACAGCAASGGRAGSTEGESQTKTETEAESSGEQTASGEEAGQEVSRDIFAMDTVMNITTYGPEAEAAADAAAAEIERLDAMLSTGLETSEISVLNREHHASVSEENMALIERSQEIHALTDGAFDITVYPLMEAWGFPSEKYRVPAQEEIEELLLSVNMDSIVTDREKGTVSFSADNTRIDLGAIAKGYTSARLMDIFREYGLTSAKVSLGGNVQLLGSKPDGSLWRIGIENKDGDDLAGVLETENMAVITSGGYERYFEENGKRYHHILDPATGYPAENGLASVTIVSADGTLADALATALFVMGKDKACEYWRDHSGEFEMILQDDDGKIFVTEGIRDSFSSEGPVEMIKR